MDNGSEHRLAAASALDRWREDTLRLVLPVLVVLGFPTIISDLLGAFQRRDFTMPSFTELTYLGLVLLMLLPRILWRVRAAWMVALLLTLGVTLLIDVGLVGAGHMLIVLAVVLAAFFFDSRTTRKANEALVAQQLRYAQTLADCSRLMLNHGQDLDAYQATLDRVLEMIRAAICADRVTILRSSTASSDAERASLSLNVLSRAAKPGLSSERQPTPEEILVIDAELRRWQGTSSFNGAVAGSFPSHPAFERYLRDVGVRSILSQPLTLGGDEP
jgi:hypothetical protein